MWETVFSDSEETFTILILKAVIISYVSKLFYQAPPGSHTHLSKFSKKYFLFLLSGEVDSHKERQGFW